MVAVWQELLGIEPVGVDDNFFELGGDSVQGIQLVIGYRQLGFEVSLQQVFENQSIAALAAVVNRRADDSHGRESYCLAPAQRRFLGGHDPASAVVLRCATGAVSGEHLVVALEAVVNQHPALRTRLAKVDDTWRQVMDGKVRSDSAIEVAAPHAQGRTASMLSQLSADLAASLDPHSGALVRAAILTDEERHCEVLLAIHEVAADAVSIRILLDDLTVAWRMIANGTKPQLRRRGASFPEWLAELQREIAKVGAVQGSQCGSAECPSRDTTRSGETASRQAVSLGRTAVALTEEETERLFDVVERSRVSVEELLVNALVSAGSWAIELEQSLRAEALGGLDLRYTIGPLHCVVSLPAHEPANSAGNERRWASIKNRVRLLMRDAWRSYVLGGVPRIPRGAGAVPKLRVAYLGDFNHVVLGGAAVDVLREPIGALPANWLALHASCVQRRFRMHWEYDSVKYVPGTVEEWARRVCDELRSTIAIGCEGQAVELVASDFPLANLGALPRERFADLLRKLQDSS